MKRLSLLLALLLAAGVATAQAAGTTHHKSSGKLHAVKAEGEVVSVDATAKTATVKVNGEEMTHPVKGTKAVAELSKLKAGDKVNLTVMANAAGEHQYISSIRPAMGSTSTAAEKKPAPAAKKKS
jgi:Cu/Ag efflux protein CusF